MSARVPDGLDGGGSRSRGLYDCGSRTQMAEEAVKPFPLRIVEVAALGRFTPPRARRAKDCDGIPYFDFANAIASRDMRVYVSSYELSNCQLFYP